MTYNWVSVSVERYYTETESEITASRPLLHWYLYSYNGISYDYIPMLLGMDYTKNLAAAINDIVPCVVQDFREAVGASLYDEAKDDTTLVPIGCLIHVDAIVMSEFCRRCDIAKCLDYTAARYIADSFKDAKKRATIYRRELGVYLKKQLVGETFPEELPEGTVDATPFYTKTNSRTARSL